MNGIGSITLRGVLPRVFAGEGRDSERRSQLWHTDVTLERGQCYAVNAPSGTGKTSLCSFLMGVRDDYEGTILFDERDIRKLKVSDWCALRRTSLAYVPQELELFDGLTALDNVMLKNRLTEFRSEAEVRRMFDNLGIADRINTPAGRMSVGQRQRVAIIRALCQPFDFILLDEPVSHLDAVNNALCGALIRESTAALGASVVYTSVGNPLDIPGDIIHLDL